VSEELASGRRIRTVPDDQVDYTAIEPRDFTTDRRMAGWEDIT